MKQFLRSFSLGLFLASLIIFIFFNYFDEPEIDPNELSTNELIDLVEEDGYRVITEEDYITYTVNDDQINTDDKDKGKNNDEDAEKKENKDKKDKVEDEKENDDIVKYTLDIKPGLMPHEVIQILEEKKIIKDAGEFSKFMEENDYSPYIQQGTFDLTSDMSDKEIAKKITNK